MKLTYTNNAERKQDWNSINSIGACHVKEITFLDQKTFENSWIKKHLKILGSKNIRKFV